MLSSSQLLIFDWLRQNPGAKDRVVLAEGVGWGASSGHLRNVLAQLSSMEIVRYPSSGSVELQPWILEQEE